MYIRRHVEEIINKLFQAYPVIIITGPRQVGKSTLLKKYFSDINYITMDDLADCEAVKRDSKDFLELQGTPLILDEVQLVPEIFPTLKLISDSDRHNGMYILTSSQRYQLMQNISESLAGRIGIIEMLGLSNRELANINFEEPFLPTLDYLKKRKKAGIENISVTELWNRIHKGSMPEIYSNDNLPWKNFYSDYVRTYIERDVRQLANVGDAIAFNSFITALAARTGELLNINSLANDVGIDNRTAKRWLSILEASGIIYILRPFSTNINKRVVKTPKIYFTDTGLVCYLCRWLTPDNLRLGAMSGAIYETYVISEIIKSYYNKADIPDLFFYRDASGKEIDLLIYQNNCLYPIEIKKTSSPNLKDIKHFSVLQEFKDIEIGDGGVICNHDKLLPLQNNFRVIPINYI